MRRIIWAAAAAAAALSGPAESQAPPSRAALTYADLADLALPAPIVAHVRLSDVTRLRPEEAPGVAPGRTRFFIEAEVVALIRGAEGLPRQVRYLADVSADASGRAPRLRRKSEYLVLAAPVVGRPGELRLVAPDAQLQYSPALAAQLRGLLREAVQADAAPAITGIGKAFHVPGSLPGESETQIFLQGAGQRPLSLNILRRPGEAPRWSVALSEIVDEAAAPPVKGSLLWYRLACTLPARLPPQSFVDAEAAERQSIEADYRLVMEALGPCPRSRPRLRSGA